MVFLHRHRLGYACLKMACRTIKLYTHRKRNWLRSNK